MRISGVGGIVQFCNLLFHCIGKEYTQKHALEQHMRHHVEGEVELEFPSYGPPTGKRRKTQYHVQVDLPLLYIVACHGDRGLHVACHGTTGPLTWRGR